jgi:hypothetical protein
LRNGALEGTSLAKSQFDTIRLRLLKIGARLEVKKRKIRFHPPKSDKKEMGKSIPPHFPRGFCE